MLEKRWRGNSAACGVPLREGKDTVHAGCNTHWGFVARWPLQGQRNNAQWAAWVSPYIVEDASDFG
jgi:hypothetical protein